MQHRHLLTSRIYNNSELLLIIKTLVVLTAFLCLVPKLYSLESDSVSQELAWPIEGPHVFTSTYGEYRPDRFHAGLDFSTNGGTGLPCYAVGDGFITRLKISFNGYGKVLYLQLDDGRLAVYAHLDRFVEEIEYEVQRLQLEKEWYEIETFFEKDQFRFKKGDLIGYSGDTGSGAPHLHFEMRENMRTSYDPMLDGLVSTDTELPVIAKLALRPLDGSSEVNGDMLNVVGNVNKGRANQVSFSGKVGVSVRAHDRYSGTWYKLGLHKYELWVDGELRHVTMPESFDYSLNRHSRLDFDFELMRRGYKGFRRLYVLEENKLDFYDNTLKGGILDSEELGAGDHLVEVKVYDFAGNVTSAQWTITALEEPTLPTPLGNGPSMNTIRRNIDADSDNIEISIVNNVARVVVNGVPDSVKSVHFTISSFLMTFPMVDQGDGKYLGRANISLDLYDELIFAVTAYDDSSVIFEAAKKLYISATSKNVKSGWFAPDRVFSVEYDKTDLWFDLVSSLEILSPEENHISNIYSLKPYEYPFANPFKLRFHSDVPWDTHAVIVYRELAKNGEWMFLGNEIEDDGKTLVAVALSNEDFAVTIDTTAPEILNYKPSDMYVTRDRQPEIQIFLEDTLSGLNFRESEFLLDGEKVVWIFDPDKDKMYYRPWAELPAGDHTWEISVQDMVGNTTKHSGKFTIIR